MSDPKGDDLTTAFFPPPPPPPGDTKPIIIKTSIFSQFPSSPLPLSSPSTNSFLVGNSITGYELKMGVVGCSVWVHGGLKLVFIG